MKFVFLLLLFVGCVHAETQPVNNQDEQLKLGLSLIQEKKYQLAETHFNTLKTKFPLQITYLNNLAVAQMAQGKTELALDNLKQAAVSDKYFSVMQKNISDVYAFLASQAYAKALEKEAAPSAPELLALSEIKQPPSDVVLEEKAIVAVPISTISEVIGTQLKEILEVNVSTWSQAWMNGDSKAYIAVYSKKFIPSANLSYKDWLAQRRYRLRHSKQVEVSYNELNIFFNLDKTSAVMEFFQHYKAGQYQDKVRKQLFWQLENDSWLITREQVIENL